MSSQPDNKRWSEKGKKKQEKDKEEDGDREREEGAFLCLRDHLAWTS